MANKSLWGGTEKGNMRFCDHWQRGICSTVKSMLLYQSNVCYGIFSTISSIKHNRGGLLSRLRSWAQSEIEIAQDCLAQTCEKTSVCRAQSVLKARVFGCLEHRNVGIRGWVSTRARLRLELSFEIGEREKFHS